MAPNQKDIDDSVQDIFGGTGDDASDSLDSLDQSDLASNSPSRRGRPGSTSSNNPLDKVRDQLQGAQDKVGQIKNSAGKIKNGAEQVQNVAGKMAKGTGKLAEAAGKVEKVAGKVAETAGKVEKAAGNIEKGIGTATNVATDAAVLGEQAVGLLAAIPTLGISEVGALGASGLTELFGKGAGTSEQAVGEATKAIGEGTDALGKATDALGKATEAGGKAANAAGNISDGMGKSSRVGKAFLDEGLKGKLFKQFMPFGTRWLGKGALKNVENEFGSISSWQLVLMLIAAVVAPFILAYFLIVMPVTYFFQMAGGLMGQETNGSGSGGGGPFNPVTGNAIVDAALSQVGRPYIWAHGDCNGPTGGGFDCSGLTMYAINQGTGICLDHYSQSQCGDSRGTKISNYSDLQPGDLMCFGTPIHHVAIYMEPEKYIDAPRTGEDVQVHPHSRTNDFRWGMRFTGSGGGGGGGGAN